MNLRPGKVLVVGSANADLVATVDRFPAPGETIMAEGFATHPGGKGANQAVAAARIGAQTFFAGCVGDDAHGDLLRKSLFESGTDLEYLQTTSEHPTGTAIILVDRGGQNQITVISGANHAIDPANIPIESFARQGIQTLLLQLEISIGVVNECLVRAKGAGMTTILNPAPSTGYEMIEWSAVDVLIANESETDSLGGHASQRGFIGTSIVTLGKGGCELRVPNEIPRRSIAPEVDAVDTTGAGDCFCGVAAALWHQADDKLEACRLAMMAASLSVTRRGAQPSMPTFAEVERFVAGL